MSRFVDLSLFYFVRGTDGYVVWGEGLVSAHRSLGPSVSSENLGDGLRLLRVANDFSSIAKVLQQDIFTYRRRGTATSIHLGLKIRPPVLAAALLRPNEASSVSLVHQFVRASKAAALGASSGGSSAPTEEIETVLDAARTFTGRDFRGVDAPRLGDVLLIEDAPPAPVSFTALNATAASPDVVHVTIEPHARKSELAVNVRVEGSDDAVLEDVLVRWKPGDAPTFSVPTNQRSGAVELRVWSAGRLIWEVQTTFILEAAFNMSVLSGSVVLNDRLTDLLDRAIKAGNAPPSALPPTRTVTQQAFGSHFVVGAELREPWRQAFLSARTELFALAPPAPAPEEYFPQGGGGRAAAIQAFTALLEGGRSFLIDPFFDAVGAADLLPRIQGEVDLTVITSLPDDEQRSSERLVSYLREARGYLPSGIKIRRVTRGAGGEQAFHDRFLIVMPSDGEPRGFLLSNSFSGLARKYPMVVAKMSSGTTAAVLDDIEEMLASKTVTELWPLPGPGPAPVDAFGCGWRWYLVQLVSPARSETGDRLETATAQGWLAIDAEGNPRWSTDRTQEVLDRILPRRPSQCLSRLHPRAAQAPRQAALGFRVAALGERVARGLAVRATEVAARLVRGDAHRLRSWLRESFRSPDGWERHGHWRTRVAMHQALQDATPSRTRVEYGMALWADTHVAMDLTHEYGRAFVYAVLLIIHPEIAINVAVELGDPTFIAAALDWWHHEPWPLAISRAALSSSSTAVKAMGVQSLAAPETRGFFSRFPIPPAADALPALLRQLEDVDPTVVAFACLEWASRAGDDAVRLRLVAAAVDRFPQLSPDNIAEASSRLLAVHKLLAALAEASNMTAQGRSVARAAVGDAFASTVARPLDEHRWADLVRCAEHLATILFAQYDSSFERARLAVERLLDLDRARSQVRMLSPFRRHPEWNQAAARLGYYQLLLLHLRSRSHEDVDVESTVAWSYVAEASPAIHAAIMEAVGRR